MGETCDTDTFLGSATGRYDVACSKEQYGKTCWHQNKSNDVFLVSYARVVRHCSTLTFYSQMSMEELDNKWFMCDFVRICAYLP